MLTTELEKLLLSTEYNFAITSKSQMSFVIDFISLMKRINLTNLQTFKNGFEVIWKSVLSVSAFNQLNILYESYIKESMKHGKREHQGFSTKTLNICKFAANIIIPVHIEKFRADYSNKENLQEVSRTFFHNKSAQHNVRTT